MKTIYKCCHCGTELENQVWCPDCEVEIEDYDEEEVPDTDDEIEDADGFYH